MTRHAAVTRQGAVTRRVWWAAGAASTVAAAGSAVVAGLGWYYSTVLLDPTQRPLFPERVLATDPRRVVLAATRLAAQPGVWGLRTPEGLSVVGPISSTGGRGTRGGYVVRPLLAGAPPAVGAAALDTGPYDPDPGARGLSFDDIVVPGPLGGCPAWFVPAPAGARPDRADTWVIAVHGRGGSRREVLRVLPAVHTAGHPVLVISYRNDPDAPGSPDGHYHLGDTEWEDLAAAVRLAVDGGARRVVLYGWSMGAAISAAFLERSPDAGLVAALIWDAPLIDWRRVLRQQARNRRLPAALVPVASAATRHRIGIDFDRFDLLHRPPAHRPPTLIVHSDADTAVPVQLSRDLVAAAVDLDWPVTYREVAGVEHTAAWNADPARYEAMVTAFLAELDGSDRALR